MLTGYILKPHFMALAFHIIGTCLTNFQMTEICKEAKEAMQTKQM